MFTGIIEDLGIVTDIKKDLNNLHITIKSVLIPELKVDQSVSHNGVCLTVVNKTDKEYTVTAINETINKTNIGKLEVNDIVNLERGMRLGDRLDGHIVQGHVDQTARCININEDSGSWVYTFKYDSNLNNITIEKGSITINGVSLTVVDSGLNTFSVAIIPFTFENTNFNLITVESEVNLEFDVLGKYVKRLLEANKTSN